MGEELVRRDIVVLIEKDPKIIVKFVAHFKKTRSCQLLVIRHDWNLDLAFVLIDRIALVVCEDRLGGVGENGINIFFRYGDLFSSHRIPFILLTSSPHEGFFDAATRAGMHPFQKKEPCLVAFDALVRQLGVTL